MKQARFHVFSGTGNSLHLARTLAARLTKGESEVELHEVEHRARPQGRTRSPYGAIRESGDLDLFLFPVYAMSAPRIMLRYLRALGPVAPLPDGSKPRAVVLSTNGRISARFRDGHEGQALAQAERSLTRRGWEVVHRDTFDYPQGITTLITPQDEERRRAIMALVEPRIEATATALENGRFFKRPCRLPILLVSWPFGWLYRIFGRRVWAMLFAADGNCDGCGLCARRCPAGAIRMIGKRPAWSYACEGCERCINLCPKRAIQASFVRLVLMFGVFISAAACPLKPLLSSLLAPLPPAAFPTIWAVLVVVLGFLALRLADLLLVALSLVPPLRPVLAFGWTAWFRRYTPPKIGESARGLSQSGCQNQSSSIKE